MLFLCSKFTNAQSFIDVAAFQNIVHTAQSTDESASGVSFYDFDDDGWDDITLTSENDTILFYKNNQGVFEMLPIFIYITGETKHAIWVDYDNDGQNDLFISIKNAPCRLFHNDGNLNLTDVTFQAGLFNSAGPNYGASFGDYNKDGFLDLYLCRYSDAIFNVNSLELNALYKNNGDGTFTNIATQSGVDDGIKNSFQGVWLDYNKDGWSDLYVINDKYDYLNSLYKNNGDGSFTDVTAQSGMLDSAASPMTNSVADFDEDGDLDIFMTGTSSPDDCRLMVNNNDGTFSNLAVPYGVTNGEFTWGSAWFDAENDTDLDLMVLTDINTNNAHSYMYINTGAQLFVEMPQAFQSNNIASSRSIAIGDISNDGKTDLIVSNTDGYSSFLWENLSNNNNNYIKITLKGSISNKMAIGSWIYVYAGNSTFSHYTFCGENYMGQNSQHHIFGLNQNQIVDSIIIHFQSGVIDKYYNLAVNQAYTFFETENISTLISYSGSLSFCTGDSIILDAGNYSSFLWSNGANTRFLTVEQSGIYWVDVTNSLGVTLFSDTLTIMVASNPQISIQSVDLSCFGTNDGSIILDVVNQTSNYTIHWNQGLQGDTLTNLQAGNYTFLYNDIFGCTYADSISILSPYPIDVFFQVTGYSAIGMGSINSIINGGTSPYAIYLNGILESNFIDSLMPGNYLFEVFDASGCVYNNSVQIFDYTITFTNPQELDDFHFQNPINSDFTAIDSKKKISQIIIFNSLGQEIPSFYENNILRIDACYFGILYLKFIAEDGVHFFKVFKL